MPPPWLSDESLYVPVYAASLSVFAMAIHRIAIRARRTSADAPHAGRIKPSSLKDCIVGLGGLTAAILNALRVVFCLTLLSLSLYSATLSQPLSWISIGFCATYVSLSPIISPSDDTEGLSDLCSRS